MSEKLIHEIAPVGMLQWNCSILRDPEARAAIVVDPSGELERALEILRARQPNVRAIVRTHAHIYNVDGLVRLHAVPRLPVRNAVDR